MFSLKDLLKHETIVIQCHNYPDADSLASALGLYSYLRENDVRAGIIYSGNAQITKPNLVKMLDLFSIPIAYKQEMSPINTLVTVDCQYGEGNVTKFESNHIYQLDHHQDRGNEYPGAVKSYLGSCATLIWDLLREEGFSFEKHPNVSTALYYGLYTDTNNFEEIAFPLDKDLRDNLGFDKNKFDTLRYSNLTIEELTIAGRALVRHKIDRENNFAIFKADECDPNVLGFISDLAMQVDGTNVIIVYSVLPNGCKISVRSCTRDVMANEIAEVIAHGGGHKQKAGGFIPSDKLVGRSVSEFIENHTKEYFSTYDIIHSETHELDVNKMPKYTKLKIPLGCVLSTDIFEPGTPMLIRSLEGDSDANASPDILLMIGYLGEVYPIHREKFTKSYTFTDKGFIRDYIYSPTIKNKTTGEAVNLIALAKACIPTGQSSIHATPLKRNTKLFNRWHKDSYMAGVAGDYIAVRADDYGDVYIIKREIFKDTYASI